MSLSTNLAETFAAWANTEPSVKALVLIGSQARSETDVVWRADELSDWDFQVITSKPDLFFNKKWIEAIQTIEVKAYTKREARLGDVPKISAIFTQGEADFVLLPAKRMEQAKNAMLSKQQHIEEDVRRSLQSLAIVVRPGWRFLKGAMEWGPFYDRLVIEVLDPRLNDGAVRDLAEGFVCDYVWAFRKLARGEFLAVQRMLHRELAETNFRLLHELKLRRNERTFPDARRLERIASREEVADVRVDTLANRDALKRALHRCGDTLQSLVGSLSGVSWRWPLSQNYPLAQNFNSEREVRNDIV